MLTATFSIGSTGASFVDDSTVRLVTSQTSCEYTPGCTGNLPVSSDFRIAQCDLPQLSIHEPMVFDVAAFIIDLLHNVTVSKLQLLLYYCQAWSLVWDDMPVFSDSIIAGPNGPYVERIKETFRGEFTINSYPFGDGGNLSEDIRETCRVVVNHYGRYNAQELIFLAESEQPWKQAREKSIAGSNPIISFDEMTTFYRSLLESHE